MSTLDTLEILIEADSRGLETQLKKAGATVSQFVDKMNSQEVNWQSILAGSLDTAIIGGIASSFALAITQAMQFQNSMLSVSNNTASGFGSATGDMTNQIIGLAGQTGASIGDTASAFQMLYKQFGDTAIAQKLTADAGQLALASNMNLMDIMPMLIDLFNNWGVTTLPAAEDALKGLANEAGKGKFTLQELMNLISNQGQTLQGVTNINAVATQIQALSNQAGISKQSVVDAFNAIAGGVANPIAQINILNGGVASMAAKMRQPDGLILAFSDVSKNIKAMGEAGVTMGQQMGLSLTTASQLGTINAKAFLLAKQAADEATASQKPLQEILDANMSTTDKLSQDYQKFLGILTTNVGIPVLDGLDALLKEINKMLTGDVLGGLSGLLKGIFYDIPNEILKMGSAPITDALNALFGGLGKTPPANAMKGTLPNSSPTTLTPTFGTPTQNSTSKNSIVNLNVTNNVSGAGGNSAAVGGNIASQLYNMFQGTTPLQ